MINNKLYINGKWKNFSKKKFFTYNPLNNKKVSSYIESNDIAINKALESANHSFKNWSNRSFKSRAEYLSKITSLIKKNKKEIARAESLETGKSFTQSNSEILGCVKLWNYSSKLCKSFKNKKKIKNFKKTFIQYSPVGVVVLIIPWNFPLIVLSERLPFILAAGCTVVVKPSEYAGQGIVELLKFIKKANLPKGVINFVSGRGKNVGVKLIKSNKTKMVSFTGSTKVGREIYQHCAKDFKRVNLELGGKNKFIILNKIEFNKTVDELIRNFTFNSGQNCVAASEVYINQKIFKKFTKILINELNKKIHDLNLIISNKYHYNRTKKLINFLNKRNYKTLNKISKNEKKNHLFPRVYGPEVMKEKVMKEENFAPIITINKFKSSEDLIKIINDNDYGLAIYLWGNKKKILPLVPKIEVGRIWVNSEMINFPNLPIGGLKHSGLNKEAGYTGIEGYSNIKTVICS